VLASADSFTWLHSRRIHRLLGLLRDRIQIPSDRHRLDLRCHTRLYIRTRRIIHPKNLRKEVINSNSNKQNNIFNKIHSTKRMDFFISANNVHRNRMYNEISVAAVAFRHPFLYNTHATAMESYEPGQGRKTAALRGSFMCGGLFSKRGGPNAFYIHARSDQRSSKSVAAQ
jgi:hypothetical protein